MAHESTTSLNGSGPEGCGDEEEGRSLSLSIIVPVFNEFQRVRPGLEELLGAIAGGPFDGNEVEVIVADDGSTDGTEHLAAAALASFAHSRIIRLPVNRGKGAAVRAGVAAAQGSNIVFMDVDMAVPPSDMTVLLSALEDADIAMGSRTHSRSSIESATAHRILMGRTFHWMARSAVGVSYRDTQCGFKAFRAPVARLLFHFSTTERFAFDVEVLKVAGHLGFSVAEVPVLWRHVAGSRIRPLLDPSSMMVDLLRIRRGSAAVPDVPGVVLAGGEGCTPLGERVRQILGPTVPVLPWEIGGALVLFPLCSGDQVESSVASLRRGLPTASTMAVSLSLEQLQEILHCSASGSLEGASSLAEGSEPSPAHSVDRP